jgi:hypothetical protein
MYPIWFRKNNLLHSFIPSCNHNLILKLECIRIQSNNQAKKKIISCFLCRLYKCVNNLINIASLRALNHGPGVNQFLRLLRLADPGAPCQQRRLRLMIQSCSVRSPIRHSVISREQVSSPAVFSPVVFNQIDDLLDLSKQTIIRNL